MPVVPIMYGTPYLLSGSWVAMRFITDGSRLARFGILLLSSGRNTPAWIWRPKKFSVGTTTS